MPRHRVTGLEGFSTAQIEAFLETRRSGVVKLQRRREGLAKELEALDEKIAAAGGDVGGGEAIVKRGRPRGRGGRGPGGPRGPRLDNSRSLADAIELVLSQHESLKVGDLVAAVEATGYKTKSKDFRAIINQALMKNRKRFGKVARGVYALKK